MFVHYRTLGFVLKKDDQGEADQIFTIYTKDFGKLKILGKAIRKIKSKLRAETQPFCLLEIEFIQGKGYKTLTDVIQIGKFQNLRKNLDKLTIAYEIAEVLDNLIRGEELDKEIWELLLETFKKLDNCSISHIPYSLIYYYFLWNFFSILGYESELECCAICQKKLTPANLYFSPERGGVICNDCFKKAKTGKKINPGTIKILRLLIKKNWEILSRLKIEPRQEKELEIVSKNYLSHLSSALDIS